ncbi:hypothetical protein B0H13DRAFT_640174 [Mycena leptocephala]|nr:hypothetical protein B0H13DRAFT_640174 [Mycena leptocephala]
MCEFDACERDMGGFSSALFPFPFPPFSHPSFLLVLPTLLFLPSSVYTDVVLSHPARAHPFHIAASTPVAPSRLAGASCTTCTATTCITCRARRPSAAAQHGTRPAQPLSACLMHPAPTTSPHVQYIAPAAVPRPNSPHQAPTHPRYDAQEALPFFVAHGAFVEPAGAAMIFSGVTTISVPTRTTTEMCDPTAMRSAPCDRIHRFFCPGIFFLFFCVFRPFSMTVWMQTRSGQI